MTSTHTNLYESASTAPHRRRGCYRTYVDAVRDIRLVAAKDIPYTSDEMQERDAELCRSELRIRRKFPNIDFHIFASRQEMTADLNVQPHSSI